MNGLGVVDRNASVFASGAVSRDASVQLQAYSRVGSATTYEAIQRAGEMRGDSQAEIEASKSVYAEAAGLPTGGIPSVREAVSEYARANNRLVPLGSRVGPIVTSSATVRPGPIAPNTGVGTLSPIATSAMTMGAATNTGSSKR